MKKFILGVLVGGIIFGSIPLAASIEEYICHKADYKLIIYGQEYNDPELPLMTYKGHTIGSVRKILEAAGLNVEWNAELGQAEVSGLKNETNNLSLTKDIIIPFTEEKIKEIQERERSERENNQNIVLDTGEQAKYLERGSIESNIPGLSHASFITFKDELYISDGHVNYNILRNVNIYNLTEKSGESFDNGNLISYKGIRFRKLSSINLRGTIDKIDESGKTGTVTITVINKQSPKTENIFVNDEEEAKATHHIIKESPFGISNNIVLYIVKDNEGYIPEQLLRKYKREYSDRDEWVIPNKNNVVKYKDSKKYNIDTVTYQNETYFNLSDIGIKARKDWIFLYLE
ncbi:hypothetical protein [Lutispora sp.]|uniref:hypothetical protein n=1 Tax=Lutispora sp. TaxID=2828727 RepID=UPI00356B343F